MDLGTVIGIILSMGLVVSAILTGSSLMIFISVPSALIVIGGTLGAAMVNYPLGYIIGVVGVIKNTFFSSITPPGEIIVQFMEYANRARREGILSLEPIIKEIDDEYMKKGLQLTVDGLEQQAIQDILEVENQFLSERHETGADVVAVLGTLAPDHERPPLHRPGHGRGPFDDAVRRHLVQPHLQPHGGQAQDAAQGGKPPARDGHGGHPVHLQG